MISPSEAFLPYMSIPVLNILPDSLIMSQVKTSSNKPLTNTSRIGILASMASLMVITPGDVKGK